MLKLLQLNHKAEIYEVEPQPLLLEVDGSPMHAIHTQQILMVITDAHY